MALIVFVGPLVGGWLMSLQLELVSVLAIGAMLRLLVKYFDHAEAAVNAGQTPEQLAQSPRCARCSAWARRSATANSSAWPNSKRASTASSPH